MSASMPEASLSCCSSCSWCMCPGMLRVSCWCCPAAALAASTHGQLHQGQAAVMIVQGWFVQQMPPAYAKCIAFVTAG
jgi:hypothetical protein